MGSVRRLRLLALLVMLMSLWGDGLLSAAEIKGRVTDLIGRPLPGASIEISTARSNVRRSVTTDESGNYDVKDIPPGYVSLTANFRGFEQEERKIYARDSEPSVLDFGLVVGKLADYASGEVRGTVRSSRGVPLSQATVTVVSAFNEHVLQRSKTDSAGGFVIKVYDGGQFLVYASKPGFAVSVKGLLLGKLVNESQTVDLTLDPLHIDISPVAPESPHRRAQQSAKRHKHSAIPVIFWAADPSADDSGHE